MSLARFRKICLDAVDPETVGRFWATALDLAWRQRRPQTREEGLAAIRAGAVQRIRPKMMTVMAILMGLLPIMWSSGTGSDVMKRITAPMVGGVITSFILELLIYPAIYTIWKWWAEMRPATRQRRAPEPRR